jgi:hypothetical protein
MLPPGAPNTYTEVVAYAERLFARIRGSVAGQAAPTTLKAAFLEPMCGELSTEVALELFAKTDDQFMGMFTGGWGAPWGKGRGVGGGRRG